MTRKQHEDLKQFEHYLLTAYKANYIRAISTSQLAKIQVIGSELGLAPITNINCNQCVYDYVKKLSTLYFEYVETEKEDPVKPEPKPIVITNEWKTRIQNKDTSEPEPKKTTKKTTK